MKISNEGLVELARAEGLVVAPYKDSVNVDTVYVGHTSGAGEPLPANMNPAMPLTPKAFNDTVALALMQFDIDLDKYERRVNDAIKVPLTQYQFDALVSFDVNTGGIHRAQLTKAINRGDMSGAGFMGWLKPVEIKGRRLKEQHLFQTGEYGSGPIPLWGTDGNRKLTGVVKTMTPEEFLRLMQPVQEPRIVSGVTQGRTNKATSKTLIAQVMQWIGTGGAGAFALFNTADEQTKWIIAGLTGVAIIAGVVVFRERLQKWAKGIK